MYRISDLKKLKPLTRAQFIFIQLTIHFSLPLLATHFLQINDYITNPFEEFLGYIVGISGLFILGLPAELFENFLPENYTTLIAIGIYFFTHMVIFFSVYSPAIFRFIIVASINLVLSIWSVLFGILWMFLAMQ